jgi:hypothetical protein
VHEIRDGKIVRSRTYFDLATMIGQLGLMPAPEQAAGESDRAQENIPVASENVANQSATYVSLDEGKPLWLATACSPSRRWVGSPTAHTRLRS